MGSPTGAGPCATIRIGFESNDIHGADSFLGVLTDYAGIANLVPFDRVLFDLAGRGRTMCADRISAVAGTSRSNDHLAGTPDPQEHRRRRQPRQLDRGAPVVDARLGDRQPEEE